MDLYIDLGTKCLSERHVSMGFGNTGVSGGNLSCSDLYRRDFADTQKSKRADELQKRLAGTRGRWRNRSRSYK